MKTIRYFPDARPTVKVVRRPAGHVPGLVTIEGEGYALEKVAGGWCFTSLRTGKARVVAGGNCDCPSRTYRRHSCKHEAAARELEEVEGAR